MDLVERITDYLEGSLEPALRDELTEHLRVCWGCEHYLGEMSMTLRLLSDLPAECPSGELLASLLTLYRTWTSEVRA